MRSGAVLKCKQCNDAARLPTFPVDRARYQLHLQALPVLAFWQQSQREKNNICTLIPLLSFCRWQILTFSDCSYAFPSMLHHSKYLQDTQCFCLTCLLLRPRTSLQPLLLCSLSLSVCVVCWEDEGVALLTSLGLWILTGLTWSHGFSTAVIIIRKQISALVLRVFTIDTYQLHGDHLYRVEWQCENTRVPSNLIYNTILK